MPERDLFTDSFKGMLILWVIHIHTVFWTGDYYLPEIVRQASLLVDVSAFFFISGYLVKPSDFKGCFLRPGKQFARLYARYIVVSCLLLLFLVAGMQVFQEKPSLPPLSALTSMARVNPAGKPWDLIRIYGPSLWFIRVYLSLLVFVPLVIGLFRFRRLKLVLLAFLLASFSVFRYEYRDQAFLFTSTVYVSFYLIFYLLGTIYRAEESGIRMSHLVGSCAANALLCLLAFYHDGGNLVLQENKFPPTFQYLAYSLLLVHVFVIAKRVGRFPAGTFLQQPAAFLRWCGRNVYFIYLFQCAVCSLPYFFVPALSRSFAPFALYGMVLSFNITLTLLVTFLYVRLEAVVLRPFSRRSVTT